MIETRNDLILRILDEISFLSARLVGLRALGMSDEIAREVERLVQAAGQLDADSRARVDGPLRKLQQDAGSVAPDSSS